MVRFVLKVWIIKVREGILQVKLSIPFSDPTAEGYSGCQYSGAQRWPEDVLFVEQNMTET